MAAQKRHFSPHEARRMERDELMDALRMAGSIIGRPAGNGWGWRGIGNLPAIPELRERIEREAQAAREFR